MLGAVLAISGLIFIAHGGVVALAIGLALGYLHFHFLPAGPESVDSSVVQIRDYARDAARRKLGLTAADQAIPPIEVSGFNPKAAPSKASKDGVRTAYFQVLIAQFGADQVHIYTLSASLIEEKQFTEKTVEFFYSDVVSLSTETTPSGTTLTLSTSDGSKYECPVADSEGLDSEVNIARDLIRTKRV